MTEQSKTYPVDLIRRAAEKVEAAVRAGAERHGIDPDLAVAIMKGEQWPIKPVIPVITKIDAPPANDVPARKRMKGGGDPRLMALKDGYVMARRPGKMPFVVTLAEWLALDDVEA